MKSIPVCAASVAILTLAACGGGSSSSFSIAAFEEDFASAAGASVTDYRATIADPATLSGNATFYGVILLPTAVDSTDALAGRLHLDANFDDQSLNGSADQFALYDIDFSEAETFGDAFDKKSDLTGTLPVTNGQTVPVTTASGSFQSLEGTLSGTLRGAAGDFEVEAHFFGGIRDSATSDARLADADILGSVVGPESTITYGSDSGINGAFIGYED